MKCFSPLLQPLFSVLLVLSSQFMCVQRAHIHCAGEQALASTCKDQEAVKFIKMLIFNNINWLIFPGSHFILVIFVARLF